jgi:hypothetical protein
MDYIMLLFAGALLCNCIPHLVAGLQGARFPTPFAKPSGVGESSSLVNFVWGASNLLVGLFIASRRLTVIGPNLQVAAVVLGFLAIGLFSAVHFGKVRNPSKGVTDAA